MVGIEELQSFLNLNHSIPHWTWVKAYFRVFSSTLLNAKKWYFLASKTQKNLPSKLVNAIKFRHFREWTVARLYNILLIYVFSLQLSLTHILFSLSFFSHMPPPLSLFCCFSLLTHAATPLAPDRLAPCLEPPNQASVVPVCGFFFGVDALPTKGKSDEA